MKNLKPVILCGGSGTRLWPMSREHYPKQLLPLVSNDTLLQATLKRCRALKDELFSVAPPIVICNEEYRFLTAEQMRAIGETEMQIILEPFGRNTAPALTLSELYASADGTDPVLLVMPSDHVIKNEATFREAVHKGIPSVLAGNIVTFGVVPTRAESGYGYINSGAKVADGVRRIVRFVEKPDRTTAEKYIASGDYYWNSGIFMMLASTWRMAMERYQPAMYASCKAAFEEGAKDLDFFRIGREGFASCQADSIDYAIMEKVGTAADWDAGHVVHLDAGWSDVGAWDAVWQISPKDEYGNAIRGDVILEKVTNCLVCSSSRLVACVGIDDLAVIETPDAVLIATKSHVQDIKAIVSTLKKSSRPESLSHRKVCRPWGSYDGIDVGERFQVKRIVVKPGAVLSLQMHHHRAEHWIVVKGTALITKGEETFLLAENESTYIPLGTKHRLENPGKVPLELIEVQSGTYLGEDDIVRFEDMYGRSEKK